MYEGINATEGKINFQLQGKQNTVIVVKIIFMRLDIKLGSPRFRTHEQFTSPIATIFGMNM